jgi:hypothetical protein
LKKFIFAEPRRKKELHARGALKAAGDAGSTPDSLRFCRLKNYWLCSDFRNIRNIKTGFDVFIN